MSPSSCFLKSSLQQRQNLWTVQIVSPEIFGNKVLNLTNLFMKSCTIDSGRKRQNINDAQQHTSFSYQFDSYIHGYHVYQSRWIPVEGEVWFSVQKLDNTRDVEAVALMKKPS